MARFENVSCSQCGQSFGPGDHGYSHCRDHLSQRCKILNSEVCLSAATVFLCDVPDLDTTKNQEDLAEFIQVAIENWIRER